MKKCFPFLVIFLLTTAGAIAQEEMKEPPPPPPPPESEKSKPIPPPVIADEFYKRNPSVAEISKQEDIITVKKKDGKVEKYDISNKEDKKKFTDAYGVFPILPPPTPPPPKVVKEKRFS